jgi:predicted DCC family thiol-disulfide oxidoreductase YuxK
MSSRTTNANDPGRAPIVFFDGECGLCARSVRWLLDHDPRGVLTFAPLQGDTARTLGVSPPGDRSSWFLILADEKGMHSRSSAVLRAVSRLGGGWVMARLLLLIPVFIRDGVYDWVARHREALGGEAACALPAPEEVSRFLP